MKARSIYMCFVAGGMVITMLGLAAMVRSQRSPKPANPRSEPELILKSNDDADDSPHSVVGFLQLPSEQLLVRVGDMLYLLNRNHKILWETSVDQMINMPVADSNGRLYGIRVDHGLFSIDPSNGEVDYFGIGPPSGRDYYTQIKPYRDGQYLVVTNWQAYRDNACPKCDKPNDHLSACKGKEQVWDVEIPPNSQVELWGDKIFTVTKRKDSVVMREVVVPKRAA